MFFVRGGGGAGRELHPADKHKALKGSDLRDNVIFLVRKIKENLENRLIFLPQNRHHFEAMKRVING